MLLQSEITKIQFTISKVYEIIHNIDEIRNIFEELILDLNYNSPVIVVGAIDNRVVLFEKSKYVVIININLDFTLLESNLVLNKTSIEQVSSQIYLTADKSILSVKNIPKLKLIGLYHKENFPLPRFHLAISNLAAVIRHNFYANVSMSDMQLGETIESIVEDLKANKYEVIGISVTFGQQDLLELLINSIYKIENYYPLIVSGGSLVALNSQIILEKFPNSIIAKGYGEETILDIFKYLKNEIRIDGN